MTTHQDQGSDKKANNIRATGGNFPPSPPSHEELNGPDGDHYVDVYTVKALRWAAKRLDSLLRTLEDDNERVNRITELLKSATEALPSPEDRLRAEDRQSVTPPMTYPDMQALSLPHSRQIHPLRPVPDNAFSSWLEVMEQIDPLAHAFEAALIEARERFGSVQISVSVPDYGFVDDKQSVRLAAVPSLPVPHHSDQWLAGYDDPVAAIFDSTHLTPHHLSERGFRALITVPDYRGDRDQNFLDQPTAQFRNRSNRCRGHVPEGHLLLATLTHNDRKGCFELKFGNMCRPEVQDGFPDCRIIADGKIDGAQIARILSQHFKSAGEANLVAHKEGILPAITIRTRSSDEPLPGPYLILSHCLNALADAAAEAASPQTTRGGIWLFPRSQQPENSPPKVERPELWEISQEVHRLSEAYHIRTLLPRLETLTDACSLIPLYDAPVLRRAGGQAFALADASSPPSYLSPAAHIWLYRTVKLLQEEVGKPTRPFFTFNHKLQNIDQALPFEPTREGKPFLDFYRLVQQLRESEDYGDPEIRRRHAQVAIDGIKEAFKPPS